MRKFTLALILVAIHAVLVGLALWAVQTSTDPETGMVWIPFTFIDWPIASGLFPASSVVPSFASSVFVLGSLQWFFIGFVVQSFGRRLLHSTRKSPNNALQRTAAGGGAFSDLDA